MSLLTRCPACATLFRVVSDQLRISEGWVKCGQCSEIFDASKHLIEEARDPEPHAGTLEDTAPPLTASEPEDFEDTLLVTAPIAASLDEADAQSPCATGLETGLSDGPEVDRDATLGMNPLADIDSATESKAPAPSDAGGDLPDGGDDAAHVPDRIEVRWDDEVLVPAASPNQTEEAAPDDVPVSFLKAATPSSFWQKPMARRVLMLLASVLGLLLVAQWIYVERDQLATKYPELKPMLQVVCAVANCQVKPLQRIESLSVDSVGFVLLGKDTYRLSFVIKNSSLWTLAMPSVELALTDTQDQPVYRRVFSTTDLTGTPPEIAAGAEWPVAVALRVNPTAPEQRVLGYRLLVFYP